MNTTLLTILTGSLAALATLPVVANPIGYWRFDEGAGSTVADDSPNSNPFSQAGTTGSWVTGKIDDAYQLGGGSSRFEVASSSDLQVTAAVTVSAWVNPTAVSNFGLIAGIDQTGGSANDMYTLKTNGSGSDNLRWDVVGPGTNVSLDSTSQLFNSLGNAGDGWVHVTGVYDPSGTGFAGLYVNGALDVSTTNVPTSIQSTATPFQIGHNASDNGGNGLNAVVDDIVVYDRALSAGEVGALFSLANETALNYDAGQADILFQVFAGTLLEAEIDSLTWTQASDLGGNAGDVVDLGGGDFFLNLDGTAGVSTVSAAVPEPTSIAIWTLMAMSLSSFVIWRGRRKK